MRSKKAHIPSNFAISSKMMHKIGNVVFSNPRKSSFVRIIRLTTTPSRGIMRVFDRFSSKIADEAERKDIETLEKFTELTKYFREFNIPFDHPINNVAEKIRALRSLNELSTDMKDVQLVRLSG